LHNPDDYFSVIPFPPEHCEHPSDEDEFVDSLRETDSKFETLDDFLMPLTEVIF